MQSASYMLHDWNGKLPSAPNTDAKESKVINTTSLVVLPAIINKCKTLKIKKRKVNTQQN